VKKIHLKKSHKIILAATGALIVVLLISAWLVKGWVMDKAVAKMQEKLKSKYGLILTLKDYDLEGFSHVNMDGIKCMSRTGDTVTYFNHVTVDVRLLPMIMGKLRLEHIVATNGMVDIWQVRALKSLKKDTVTVRDSSKFNKIHRYLGYLEEAATMMPSSFTVSQVRMVYADSADKLTARIDSMSYADSRISSALGLKIKGVEQRWNIHGEFNKNSLKTDVEVRTSDTTFYNIAFIKQLAKAQVGVRNFRFRLDDIDDSKNEISLDGGITAQDALFYNERLADDTITVRKGGIDFKVQFTPDKITLMPGSRMTMNEVSGDISGEYRYKGHETVSATINMAPVNAQTLVNSFPKGTFTSVNGMKISGKFSYKFNFYFDISKKDSIRIDSDLDGSPDLKVEQWGEADLSKLQRTFTYHPYNSKRPIVVGPENPNFTPYNQISPYLRNAVLTSEDPSFFRHKGFVEEAIEQSFIKNVKTGEFRRGGSTISMQLVKNVFLTHKKTIERKLEEAFLVWLMENLKVVDKARMLEVYMNIIEWGPNVYGVGEAAPFYFNTTPANLTLNEAIYLAVIIPQPLGFQWKFDTQGQLKEYMQNRVDLISKLMEMRGLISQDQYLDFTPNVFINGRARNYLKIEPTPEDTLHNEDEFDWKDILDLR
jgi:hypothetical protein